MRKIPKVYKAKGLSKLQWVYFQSFNAIYQLYFNLKKKKELQTVRRELRRFTPRKDMEKERDLQPQRIKVKNDTCLTNREYLKQ